jgi:hypothetical protein
MLYKLFSLKQIFNEQIKVFLKLKNPKNSLFWVKKPPKNQKNQKNQKKTKNPNNPWAGFFLNPGFFQPCMQADRIGHGYHVLEDEALYARCLKELAGPRKWVKLRIFLDREREKNS